MMYINYTVRQRLEIHIIWNLLGDLIRQSDGLFFGVMTRSEGNTITIF